MTIVLGLESVRTKDSIKRVDVGGMGRDASTSRWQTEWIARLFDVSTGRWLKFSFFEVTTLVHLVK